MTKEEQIITYLLNELPNCKTNVITISKSDIPKLNLPERDIVQTLYVLQEDDLINIKSKSVHDDFSMYWNIALKSPCIHYFENKKEQKKEKRNQWIQFWIPVILSAIAIIVSIVALILGL